MTIRSRLRALERRRCGPIPESDPWAPLLGRATVAELRWLRDLQRSAETRALTDPEAGELGRLWETLRGRT